MPNIAKLQSWKVLINGAIQTIKVLATQAVDLTSQNGSAGSFDFYDNSKVYNPGNVVVVQQAIVVGGVTLTPGTYGCRLTTLANASGNQVPQFPLPTTGTVYWILIALGPQLISVCQNGTKNIYINASSSF